MIVSMLHLGVVVFQVEADLEGVLQLVKEKKGPELSALELKQVMKVLELRERQFQDVIQLLKRYSWDKVRKSCPNRVSDQMQ